MEEDCCEEGEAGILKLEMQDVHLRDKMEPFAKSDGHEDGIFYGE